MSTIIGYFGVFLSDGFMYSLLAMGFYVSFSTLDFPDLSVEGTVLAGGLAFSYLSKIGVNPWLALIGAFFAGAIAGSVTGLLHVKLHIRPLLCGILVSTALISVNLVTASLVNGGDFKANGNTQVMMNDFHTLPDTAPARFVPTMINGFYLRKLLIFFAIAVIFKILMDLFFKTKSGLLLKAAGNNEQYVSMLGRDPGNCKILGLALGNGYAAVSGALIVQSRGSATQDMGLGMIVIGLASVIIGLSLFGKIRFMKPTTMVILGSIIYQACLTIASALGIPSAYNKLVMAILFTLALVLSYNKKREVVTV